MVGRVVEGDNFLICVEVAAKMGGFVCLFGRREYLLSESDRFWDRGRRKLGISDKDRRDVMQ